MNINVVNTSHLGRRLTVQIPAQDMEQEIDTRSKKVAETAKIDGFRQGKAPLNMIKNRYGKAIRDEVVNDKIQSSLYEALVKEKLNPTGAPMIEEIKFNAGEPLEYVAVFEIYPEIKLVGLETIEIEKDKVTITEKDVDQTLDKIRKQNPTWRKVEHAAKTGDQLIADFEGDFSGTGEDNQSQKDMTIVLGSKTLIPGFEDGLLGVKVGETRVLDLTFPEDYHNKKLSGKPAKFSITVTEISEPDLPTLDDDFAKRLGIKEGGLSALRGEIEKHMQRELNNVMRNNLKTQLFDKLLALHPLEVPKSLIDREASFLHQQMHTHDHAKHDDHSVHDHPELEEHAKRRVSISLLMAEIIKEHKIQVNKDRMRTLVEETAGSYEYPEQVVSWYYSDKERLKGFESLALEEQVVDLILEKGKITEKPVSYTEAMHLEDK